MNKDIVVAIQHYTARSAITSSSMRGASKGTIASARAFLSDLSLRPFGTSNQSHFTRQLDQATKGLLRKLPKTARHWGRARKGLNIFLRGCLYTTYLREKYNLAQGERFFEVPLDSITGVRLFERSGKSLPRWKTVQGLSAATSAQYQAAAAAIATQNEFARVHLDAIWWGQRDAKAQK